jgi:Protein of unknown function (DUF2523)
MQAILFKVFRWLIGASQVKFIGFTMLFAFMNYFIDTVTALLNDVISITGLTSAFSLLPPSIWYFLNLFNLTYGIPLIIGAYITRFLIRRIPVIG